jgi:hypothetical protein
MKRLLACVVVVLFALVPSVAGAGGWAVASLDALPTARAGQSVDVGFRLLQHGRTPVVADEWAGSTIGLGVRADGQEWFVAATMDGEAGHYVATVDVPTEVTQLAISVQMRDGLFVEEAWADVVVDGATGSGDAGSGWFPTWLVPLLALAAGGCGAMIAVELRSTHRRRHAAPATPLA